MKGKSNRVRQYENGGEVIILRANIEKMADPLWAAARGTAMYARIRQGVSCNCMEPATCQFEAVDQASRESQSILGRGMMELR